MSQASDLQVYDAAQVRLAQLGTQLLALEADDLPTARVEASILDLFFGLERVALLPAGPVQNGVLGYLIETYGLLAVGTDPFLRPWLPPIPTAGARVRRLVLGANGRAVLANGCYIGLGAELVPAAPII